LKTTFRSKLLLAAALCVLSGAAFATTLTTSTTTATTAGADIPASRMALAKAYVESVPVEDEVRAAVEQMAQNVKPEQRVLFRELAEKNIDYAKLKNTAVLATAQLFTDDEIKAMTTFFSSPEGKSIRAKMPAYEARMQPVMVDVLQTFALKLQENNVAVDLSKVGQ
jgi:hypothetical protein